MQGFAGAFGVGRRPERDKGATAVHARVLVANNGNILQGTKAVKGGEDLFFIHVFGDLS